jgi:hypothetical protein
MIVRFRFYDWAAYPWGKPPALICWIWGWVCLRAWLTSLKKKRERDVACPWRELNRSPLSIHYKDWIIPAAPVFVFYVTWRRNSDDLHFPEKRLITKVDSTSCDNSGPVPNVATAKSLDKPPFLITCFWRCIRFKVEDSKCPKSNCDLWVGMANNVPSRPSVNFVHDIAWWVTGHSVGHARRELTIRFTLIYLDRGPPVCTCDARCFSVRSSLRLSADLKGVGGAMKCFSFTPSSLFV